MLDTDQVALAAIALANGFTLERLAHPDGGADKLFPDGRWADHGGPHAQARGGDRTVSRAPRVDPDLRLAVALRHSRELIRRDRWTPEQLHAYQRSRLTEVVRHAIVHSAF